MKRTQDQIVAAIETLSDAIKELREEVKKETNKEEAEELRKGITILCEIRNNRYRELQEMKAGAL